MNLTSSISRSLLTLFTNFTNRIYIWKVEEDKCSSVFIKFYFQLLTLVNYNNESLTDPIKA